MFSSSTNLGLFILFLVAAFSFWKVIHFSLSKFNDKDFTLHTTPLTSGHLKNVVSGIRENPVKYFTMGAHQKYGHIDIYDIFPPQSC